jgi:DNA-directed RNA polymerase subunit H (RpoH/RPB5)
MYDTDRASKYLYVKKGQIVRIIRNTKNTETSIGYRVIAKKGNAKI